MKNKTIIGIGDENAFLNECPDVTGSGVRAGKPEVRRDFPMARTGTTHGQFRADKAPNRFLFFCSTQPYCSFEQLSLRFVNVVLFSFELKTQNPKIGIASDAAGFTNARQV
jgi:hypothetical protein